MQWRVFRLDQLKPVLTQTHTEKRKEKNEKKLFE